MFESWPPRRRARPKPPPEALYRAAGLELAAPRRATPASPSCAPAIEKSRDLERASALVAGAGVPEAELVKILPLYERIARQSGDDAVLLDYLERRAATSDVTVAEVREAVDLAVALREIGAWNRCWFGWSTSRPTAPTGGEDATWALLELLRIEKGAGELEARPRARAARQRSSLPLERVMPLARDLAERAGAGRQPAPGRRRCSNGCAPRAPADESVWRPLLDHYVALQRPRRPRAPGRRRRCRCCPRSGSATSCAWRAPAFSWPRTSGDDAAAEILQRRAARGAARTRRRWRCWPATTSAAAREGDLVDLLEQVFEAALAAGDPEAVVAAAMRLGGVLERADAERAAAMYERALGVAPGRGELLKRLLALRPAGTVTREHAELMEAVLDSETGAEAARLARELAEMWTTLGEMDSVRRVLEKGYAQQPARLDRVTRQAKRRRSRRPSSRT